MKTLEDRYPKIWKTETCLVGECFSGRTQHWWSVPFTTPDGLVSECYHCQKLKRIYVEHDPRTFKAQPVSNFVLRRLAELKED